MTLEQAKERRFDDILYRGVTWLKTVKQLPPELCKIDEEFLRNCFVIYDSIENNKPIIFRHARSTGFSTALMFVISYYTLLYPQITILVNPGAYSTSFEKVYEMFANFIGLSCDINTMSNKINLRIGKKQYCEINVLNDLAFNNADLKGPIIFDTNREMKNTSKFEDLLKTFNKYPEKYDKLVFHFLDNDNLKKIETEYSIFSKEIKIF